MSVRAREWRFGQIANRQDCDELNRRVAIMLKRVDDAVNDYLENEQAFDVEEVRRAVSRRMVGKKLKEPDDMAAWMYEQIPLLDVAPGHSESITGVGGGDG